MKFHEIIVLKIKHILKFELCLVHVNVNKLFKQYSIFHCHFIEILVHVRQIK